MKTFLDFMESNLNEAEHLFMKGKVALTATEMVKAMSTHSGIPFKQGGASRQGGIQRLDHQVELIHKETLGGKTVEVNTSFRPVDQATIKKLNLDKDITGGMDATSYDNSEIIVDIGGDGYYKTMKGKNDGSAKSINALKDELKVVGDALKSSKTTEDLISKLVSAKYKSF